MTNNETDTDAVGEVRLDELALECSEGREATPVAEVVSLGGSPSASKESGAGSLITDDLSLQGVKMS